VKPKWWDLEGGEDAVIKSRALSIFSTTELHPQLGVVILPEDLSRGWRKF
jgi:hypothetical protein